MIPVSLYGADEAQLERFYSVLPQLVNDAYEDRPYQETLFAITGEDVIQHIEIADAWAKQTPFAWPEDVVMEEVQKIVDQLELTNNMIFLLEDIEQPENKILTYNIVPVKGQPYNKNLFTMRVHRKKQNK